LREKNARSKRKKINLYRKCKDKLTLLVNSWKDTPGKEEEALFQSLKQTAKKEKIMQAIGSRRIEEENKNLKKQIRLDNQNPNLPLEKIKSLKTKSEVCEKFPTETLTVVQRCQLFSAKPATPSRTMDYGQLNKNLITKPQHVYYKTVAEANTDPVASPAHQWEKRCGDRESGNEQNNEQKTQIGPEGKL
jgi:hypothetical protein